ncbi:hypothetical protein PC129_g21644 [Phytophthora cactorum]|uniref:Uncharacterized protein n=1 Tax=Phytophthora cactorum TaxID=29920 RepID=A0A8T1H570_9STRA|nr:hypothetical protein Pcac1_g4328 [Phytophthora cactorum]KAG2796494.1 hypothetical protein PC112_g22181 [Phytophthora cactorum]KAG2824127.1 hypothetical protein PC113_g22077 [Phytophthora cactorum]KAG2885107.1 hypothetical protein PC114_g19833 [Phytophthora cactorum]KAG2910165.1 hypothetical protein PC117_g19485 [Phytophthora cactorum]
MGETQLLVLRKFATPVEGAPSASTVGDAQTTTLS